MFFSLIDRIVEIEPKASIKAVKNLTLGEEYLQDHFPGFPVMPGVLMVEALTQTCSWLMRHSENFAFSTVLLKEAKAVKFNSFVVPGDTLSLSASVGKIEGNIWTFKVAGSVGSTSNVTARMILEQSNLATHDPSHADVDQLQTEKMKELFAVLWRETPAA